VAGFVCWLTLFDADFSSKGKTIYLFKYRQEKVCLYHPLPFMCDYRLFFAKTSKFCVEKLYYYNWQLTSYVRSKSL